MRPQIPLPKNEDLDPEVRDLLSILPPLNLFRMLANAPASIKEFLEMGASILMRSEFDPRKREIAILRVACVTQAPYVWHHHVAIGKTTGITGNPSLATDLRGRRPSRCRRRTWTQAGPTSAATPQAPPPTQRPAQPLG